MTWMAFVDGENLTIRAQAFAERMSFALMDGTYWRRDRFFWLPNREIGMFAGLYPEHPAVEPLRAYYYTAMKGDEVAIKEIQEAIWRLGFTPRVFKKKGANERSKGVDITLATEMLAGAYKGTYDTAVLVAGDADYVPLVEEVKRQGRRVVIAFLGPADGLSDELRLAGDRYLNLAPFIERRWRHAASGSQAIVGLPRLGATDPQAATNDRPATPSSD